MAKSKKSDTGATIVNVRGIYQSKENEREKVTVVMWNKTADTVVYAPVGSGREFRLSTREFLDQFQLTDDPSIGRNI